MHLLQSLYVFVAAFFSHFNVVSISFYGVWWTNKCIFEPGWPMKEQMHKSVKKLSVPENLVGVNLDHIHIYSIDGQW